MSANHYIGRFAPTPSGPLHFGSLVSALGSYLDAKAHNGQWLIRIEDVDSQRCQPQTTDIILRQLEEFHLFWDGRIRVQSEHIDNYHAALEQLMPHLYPCYCSRKQWHAQAKVGALGKVYPRICKHHCLSTTSPKDAAIRLRMPDNTICFNDRLLGMQCFHAQQDIGDPILKRRDNDIAYALAVVVDDSIQGITDVVRGQDLLAATIIQQHLQTLLCLPNVRYLHLPLMLNSNGDKLSKQNHATAIDSSQANMLICQALKYLGQPISHDMLHAPLDEVLRCAINAWRTDNIPTQAQIINDIHACAE